MLSYIIENITALTTKVQTFELSVLHKIIKLKIKQKKSNSYILQKEEEKNI